MARSLGEDDAVLEEADVPERGTTRTGWDGVDQCVLRIMVTRYKGE